MAPVETPYKVFSVLQEKVQYTSVNIVIHISIMQDAIVPASNDSLAIANRGTLIWVTCDLGTATPVRYFD